MKDPSSTVTFPGSAAGAFAPWQTAEERGLKVKGKRPEGRIDEIVPAITISAF
jgi:hypothetical protein